MRGCQHRVCHTQSTPHFIQHGSVDTASPQTNRRDQAQRKREDPTAAPGSPQATPRSLAGGSN